MHHSESPPVIELGINGVSTEPNVKANLVPFQDRMLPRSTSKKLALTEQRIADLKETGSTFYVNDSRMPGLSVRVTKVGVKSYVFTKKIKGKLFRVTLGKTAGMTLSAARMAAAAHNGDIAKGVDVAAMRRAAKAATAKAMTLASGYERFLTLKDRRPSTVEDYQRLWRLHIPDILKRKPLADISPSEIEKLKKELGKKTTRTANKVVVLLSAIMSKCGRWAENPARGIERFEEHVRTRRLNADELSRLWKALDVAETGLWSDFFKVLIMTGARRDALCSMRWQDLDLDAGVWVVPATWSKNRREMAIPLTKVAVNVLERRQDSRTQSPWVWTSSKAAVGHVVNPEKPWRAFLKTAGIMDRVSLHDVRRTLGSNLAKSGAAAATISKALGHVSPQSARAYIHLDVEPARAAIEKALGGLGGAS
jgi:integrase